MRRRPGPKTDVTPICTELGAAALQQRPDATSHMMGCNYLLRGGAGDVRTCSPPPRSLSEWDRMAAKGCLADGLLSRKRGA